MHVTNSSSSRQFHHDKVLDAACRELIADDEGHEPVQIHRRCPFKNDHAGGNCDRAFDEVPKSRPDQLSPQPARPRGPAAEIPAVQQYNRVRRMHLSVAAS